MKGAGATLIVDDGTPTPGRAERRCGPARAGRAGPLVVVHGLSHALLLDAEFVDEVPHLPGEAVGDLVERGDGLG